MLNKAIFLDRDGVINKLLTNHLDRHDPSNYVVSWDQFEFIPEAIEGLKLLVDTGYLVIVVSNQSGIDRGYVDYDTVLGIFERMKGNVIGIDGIRDYGGKIDHYEFCYHSPDVGCCCRKPKPGMLYCAARHWDIDLSQSWMIGDSNSDMEAGWNAGITNLIKIDSDCKEDSLRGFPPVVFVGDNHSCMVLPNLLDAVEFLLDASSKD